MKIQDMSMKELLALHNSIADAPAGPKTFATRAKLLARLNMIAAAKSIDFAACASPSAVTSSDLKPQPNTSPQITGGQSPQKKRGLGIGELARVLIMDPTGYPHALIAAMVNTQIPGATATAKSVRWYASKMRKEGSDVPQRGKIFPSALDEEKSKEWLATIRVIREGELEQ